MWQQMMDFLKSFFLFPGVKIEWVLVAAIMAILFGAVWVYAHWPPLFKKHWLWAAAVFSAFFTLLAIVFVQIPLQYWANSAILHFFNIKTVYNWLLLIGIPSILVSGLVQEGSKMLPAVAYWWRSGHKITPRMGLAIGAIAGAAFGIFEAFWVFGQMFGAGWTFGAIRTDGFAGSAGLVERFFAIGFHTAAGALTGYGLAKGKGWQFYLIASVLHGFLNYVSLLSQKGYLGLELVETWVAVVTIGTSIWVLMLRWGKWSDPDLIAETAPVITEQVMPEQPMPGPVEGAPKHEDKPEE
ncbi:MAG TPA: hypothetical protein VMB24_02130 [Dehalococcoidales bacterium]|nr:hypothetical protein [Dehalococcoidales bacterium]